VAEPLSLVRDIITTGEWYCLPMEQTAKYGNINTNKPVQHLKLAKSYKKTVNSLHSTTTSYDVKHQEQSSLTFLSEISPNSHYGAELTSFDNLWLRHFISNFGSHLLGHFFP